MLKTGVKRRNKKHYWVVWWRPASTILGITWLVLQPVSTIIMDGNSDISWSELCAARQVNTIGQYCIILYYIPARACLGAYNRRWSPVLLSVWSLAQHSDGDMMAERINSILNEPKCVLDGLLHTATADYRRFLIIFVWYQVLIW